MMVVSSGDDDDDDLLTGEKGSAYTLITDKDKEFAPLLVRNLEGANQIPPPPLLDLANQVGVTVTLIPKLYEYKWSC